MRWIIVFSAVLFAHGLFAETLNCGALENSMGKEVRGASSFVVMKSGHYLALEEIDSNHVSHIFQMVSSGEGDADYTDFNVYGSKLVQAVSVQKSFKWAILIDSDGYSVNKCR